MLGRFSDGSPALMEYPVGAGRVIVFGSDLNNRWNNLPLQPIFVPFVHEVLRYLVGARELPSEITIADVPAGVARRPGVVTVQPGTDGAGTSASSATRRAGRRIAVNVEPGEADTTRMTVEEFRKAVVPLNSAATAQEQSDARATEASQGYWRYGLLMMLAALVAEGLIGSRMV